MYRYFKSVGALNMVIAWHYLKFQLYVFCFFDFFKQIYW